MKATERQEHIAFVDWLKLMQIPHHHSPNGGKRHIVEAMNFKKMGTQAGFPDIFIFFPSGGYHGLFIELKTSSGGKLSESQNKMLELLRMYHYCACVANGLDEAITITKNYLGNEYADFRKNLQQARLGREEYSTTQRDND